MKNYNRINTGQAYDTLGDELENQFARNHTMEIRFVKLPRSKLLYATYALTPLGYNDHVIAGFEFRDIGTLEEISGILKADLDKTDLPKEIKIIKPTWNTVNFGIFFKQK